QYVWTPNQHVENRHVRGMTDPATGGKNHGDRVIADALASFALGDEPEIALKPEDPEAQLMADPPFMSFAWRRKQWLEKQREAGEWETSGESNRGWDETSQSRSGWEPEPQRSGW